MTTLTQRWVLGGSVLAASMVFIDGTALTVAMAALQKDLGATGADLFWINNAYTLFLAALMMLGGALGDRFGHKRVYMRGIALFAGASLLCGLATTTTALIAARALQGIGGALMIPGSLAIITDGFEPERRGRAIGTWSAGTVIGSAIGPVLGGLLAQAGWWRGVFFINLPLAVGALVVLQWKVPPDADTTSRRLDYAGAVLAIVGLAGLNYGLIEAPARGFQSPVILGSLLGGVAALAGLVLVLRLFQSRTLCVAALVTLSFYGALNAIQFFLPLNLIQVQGYRAAVAGMTQLPLMILLAALSRWAGALVDRHGPRLPLSIGPAVAGLGFIWLAVPGVTAGPADFWKSYLPGLLLLGVGMGVTIAPLSTTVMGAVPTARAGLASGINSTLSRLAGVLAIAVLGPVVVLSFARALEARASALPVHVRAALVSDAGKLGETHGPAGLDAATAATAVGAVRLAFVDAFRRVCWLAAAASGASALVAAIFLKPQTRL